MHNSSTPHQPELVWLNGVVQPLASARIGLEDRGFQFADGVYEVIRIYHGRRRPFPSRFR
jgi:branched-subunit amino acid aminotransferase/4-amino-4-deoxychorismate lyase